MHEASIPDEFAMVAACCRWPLTEDALAYVRALSQRAIDWDYLARIMERHRVAGFVHHALHRAGVSISDDVWRRIKTRAAPGPTKEQGRWRTSARLLTLSRQ